MTFENREPAKKKWKFLFVTLFSLGPMRWGEEGREEVAVS